MDVAYLKSLAMSSSGFVFDPRTGHSFTTNASGLAILKRLQQGSRPEDIVLALRDEMAAPDTVNGDVQQFIDILQGFGWITDGSNAGEP